MSYVDPWGLAAEDYFPEGAPIVTIGKAYGAVAAYINGVLTNNQALQDAAMEGLECSRAENMDTLLMMATMGRGKGTPFSKGGPPRDPKTENYLPLPEAVGAHTTLDTRSGRKVNYTQGATFDGNGNFIGRTDVTTHGRGDHTNPHWHPATGPNSVESRGQPIPW